MTRRRVWSAALIVISIAALVFNTSRSFSALPRDSEDANTLGALIQWVALSGVLLGAAVIRRGGPAPEPAGPLQRPARVLLCLGVAAIAIYLVLGVLDTGVGAPTDIGGGLIPIASYVLTGIGIFKAVNDHDHPGGASHP